ncbi:outer membrane porin protein [Vibrio ponticus]|nr:outer membrane porin protein [Vibrio ponticus]
MEQMFKRTLVGAAVAAVAFSGSALAKPATETVDLYGQIAISIAQDAETDAAADKPIKMDNESRIGVRGAAQFERGPKIIWQLEGGNVGDDGSDSGLGVRDTYGGFDFGDSGKLYFGRVLTPLFEVVDGYTGQSSGTGFTAGNSGNINYDRQSNMIRYDSANLGGFSFDLGIGRGEEDIEGSNIYGAAAQFQQGVATFKVAYEHNNDRPIETQTIGDEKQKVFGEANAFIAGVNLDFDTMGFHLAYLNGEVKAEENNENNGAGVNIDFRKKSQDAIKLGAYYVGIEHWTFNLNYAANSDVEKDGVDVIGNTTAITGQAMYSIDPAAVVYLRLVHKEDETATGSETDLGWRVGMEYYF